MAKQTDLFGSIYSKSWKDAVPWPKQNGFPIAQAAALPTTWLELVTDPVNLNHPRMHDYDLTSLSASTNFCGR